MKSRLSQAAQDGRIWDGLRRSRPQTFSLFMSNSEAISHLVQSQTAGSTTQKYDNLRHGHVLVTIVNSAQACFFFLFVCFPGVKKPGRLKVSTNDLIVVKVTPNL